MTLKVIVAAAALAGTLLVAAAPAASAAEFTVNMVNKDSASRPMQFEPAFLKVAPGDTVHFVAVDKGHDVMSLSVPAGADEVKGKMSQNVDVTLTVEGLYAFKCTPHFPMGMVALIEVGAGTDATAINALKLPSKAKARMDELEAEMTAAK